jgi:hypothetical protein
MQKTFSVFDIDKDAAAGLHPEFRHSSAKVRRDFIRILSEECYPVSARGSIWARGADIAPPPSS